MHYKPSDLSDYKMSILSRVSSKHIGTIKNTENMKPRDLHRLGNDYNSIYISNESYKCALMAAGACFNSAQAILTGQVCVIDSSLLKLHV